MDERKTELQPYEEEAYTGARVPTYRKYSIGIDEAARYYGIGSKKLRQIIADNPTGDFYLEIGRHILIKRRQFEAYLDGASAL
jgi:excisionase family DNA binding protein